VRAGRRVSGGSRRPACGGRKESASGQNTTEVRDGGGVDRHWKTQLAEQGIGIFGIVADIVGSWADHPEIVGLLAVLLAENVGDDGPLRPRLRRNYRLTVERIADTLGKAQERGEMRADVSPRLKATEMLAFLSGLELAWIVSPDIPAAETASMWAAQQVAGLQAQSAGP